MNSDKVLDMIIAAQESDAENMERYVSLSKELGLITKTPDGNIIVSGKACYELMSTVYNDTNKEHIEIYVNLLSCKENNFEELKAEWASNKELTKAVLTNMEVPLNKEVISNLVNAGQLLGVNTEHTYPYEELWVEIEKQFTE